MLITCPNCGKTTDNSFSDKCSYCGEKLKQNEPSEFDEKKLVSVEELSDEELDKLNDEFFKEHPDLEYIREKKEKLLSATFNFSTPRYIKLIYFLSIVFIAIGFFLLFTKGSENKLFVVLLFLGLACIIISIIATLIDNKKHGKKVDELNCFLESTEHKNFNKIYDEWFESKGYYYPDEPED